MIVLKNNLVSVRCSGCGKGHSIEMKHVGTDKWQRSIGFEYEHIFSGELKCHCLEDIGLITTVFEYPKGELNYYEVDNKSCFLIDSITDESFDYKSLVDDVNSKE